VLHYVDADLGRARFPSDGLVLRPAEVGRELAALHSTAPVTASELAELGLSRTRLAIVLDGLERQGIVATDPDGAVRRVADADPREAARPIVAEQERLRTFDATRSAQQRSYAETDGCRRSFLLGYFGEVYEPPCGNCDNCLAGHGGVVANDVPFPAGERVRHPSFGEGAVQRYDGTTSVTVLFDKGGYRVLDLRLVRESGLLERL
jgi:ATP-dependent DNA helicase RecQ